MTMESNFGIISLFLSVLGVIGAIVALIIAFKKKAKNN